MTMVVVIVTVLVVLIVLLLLWLSQELMEAACAQADEKVRLPYQARIASLQELLSEVRLFTALCTAVDACADAVLSFCVFLCLAARCSSVSTGASRGGSRWCNGRRKASACSGGDCRLFACLLACLLACCYTRAGSLRWSVMSKHLHLVDAESVCTRLQMLVAEVRHLQRREAVLTAQLASPQI